MEQVPFRPIDLLRQVEPAYLARANSAGFGFEALASLGCDTGRLGDPEAVLKIMNILLDTAMAATGQGGVRLKLGARAGKPLTIEVSDQNETAATVDAPQMRDVEGIAAGMDGEVLASEIPGGGRTVRVTLPLSEVALKSAKETPTQAVNEKRLAGVKLLIADDSATNRLVLEEMLSDTGAEIVTVHDGQQALDAWLGQRFDMLLLDISMPVMDGLTALKIIRATEEERGLPPTPSIAVTANALAHQVTDYIMGGFDTHLSKPFRRQELLHAILTLLQ